MKKIKLGLPFYIVFFVFSLLIEIYCYLEWRDDLISVIGTSVVFLIALYLLIDSVGAEIKKAKSEYYNIIKEQYSDITHLVDKKVDSAKEEILRRQKNSVEILIKAQKSFTEAIIKNESKKSK